MSTYNPDDTRIQDLFDSITNAILTGQDDLVGELLDAANLPPGALDGISSLIYALTHTLAPQKPDERYLRGLRRDLIGTSPSVFDRVLGVPGRVRLATAFAAGLATLMWVARRRDTDSTEVREAATVP